MSESELVPAVVVTWLSESIIFYVFLSVWYRQERERERKYPSVGF